jgi:large subunit ribosomal protein L9
MEIILLKDVEKLGYRNDIVNVKPGYANNFLIPQGFAKSATASARKSLAEEIRQQSHKEAKLVGDAEGLKARLADVALVIPMKAEEGRIFGSVTSAILADALAAKGIEVDRKNIVVDGVKTVGEYEATVKLYKGIAGAVKFSVIPEE